MADLSDNFINSICFALALLYLALQAWRLARPFWAMRFEGKLAQLKKLMADNGLTFTEKELRRAVPADYAINTLLHRELTDAREIECRSSFSVKVRPLSVMSFLSCANLPSNRMAQKGRARRHACSAR